MSAFWDTNIFIYLIEEHPIFLPRVQALRQTLLEEGQPIMTSALTLGELLVRPLRAGQHEYARQYRTLLSEAGAILLVPFDRKAAELYATIRATSSVGQPDAIQLACAAAGRAKTFVTNDQRLWGLAVPGIDVIRGL